MCGICGVAFADIDRQPDHEVIARMNDTLHHRGPDGEGFFLAPGIGLGMKRLSIVDLERGDQPISSEDGNVTVICNGEIYNSAELREKLRSRGHTFSSRSDVEVIVHLYEDFGPDCVNHLRGMFAFALWDNQRRRLMLARDRLGIKPLHYSITEDACYFGSEQKAILAAGEIAPRLDVRSLADLAMFGLARTPRTFIQDVARLPPGHYMVYERGTIGLREYWDIDFTPRNTDWSEHDWAEALREKLTECVRVHLMSDVPVGAWLSAGVDSSSIAALMAHTSEQAIHTFTLAFENPAYDEVQSQKLLYDFPQYHLVPHKTVCLAEHINLLPKIIWHAEDPLSGGVEIPRMILSMISSKDFKVVMTGEGSDEILGGYELFRVDKVLRHLSWLPLPVRKAVSAVSASRFPRASIVHAGPGSLRIERYRNLIGPIMGMQRLPLSRAMRERIARENADKPEELQLPEAFHSWDPFSRLQYYEVKIRLPDRVVSMLDRVSMANSLEARVPFLDHELVEFCAAIPSSVKMRWFNEKEVLRDAMKDILPPELARRKKRGLASPLPAWLKEPLPEFAAELLSESSLRRTGYFDPVAVADMRKHSATGTRGPAGSRLASVLMVQLWDALFIQKEQVA